MSAIVPEGPSAGISAESSTIVMSPPPRPPDGSMFIAGRRSGIVCTLPPPETVSACAGEPVSALRMSLKTDAHAVAGTKVPTVTSREIRETATGAKFLRLCTCNAGLTPAEVDADFFLKIGRFGGLLSSLLWQNKKFLFCFLLFC